LADRHRAGEDRPKITIILKTLGTCCDHLQFLILDECILRNIQPVVRGTGSMGRWVTSPCGGKVERGSHQKFAECEMLVRWAARLDRTCPPESLALPPVWLASIQLQLGLEGRIRRFPAE
jgi:hypothetical protein